MWFGEAPVEECIGAVLAHSRRAGSRMLKKGRVLDAEDVAAFRGAGVAMLMVARLEPGDVDEDTAAARIGAALCGSGLAQREPFTGRANLVAEASGVALVDRDRIERVNALHEGLTVATVAPFTRIEGGQMVATIKIIPFALPEAVVAEAEACAAGAVRAISLTAFRPRRCGLVLTTLPETKAAIVDKTHRAVTDRLQALGSQLAEVETVEHGERAVAAALERMHAAGCDILLAAGASAIVDRRDVLPSALEAAGGSVVHFGMPVDPGNLLLIGKLGEAAFVGLPGCARSPKLNGVDWVLERLAAGLDVGPAEIAAMGVGGLLKEIPSRPQPRRGQPPPPAATAAAVILAAGLSRRMGASNKLLAPLDGEPMIRHVVETALASRARPVVVVTGHQADRIRAALAGLPVVFAENPHYENGLAHSIRAGIAAVPETVEGALILLGDMPRVSPVTLDTLIATLDEDEGRLAAVPVHLGKRGNPVIWHRRYFADLMRLEGDVGAKALLNRLAEEVAEVPVDDPGILLDVDTEAALKEVGGDAV